MITDVYYGFTSKPTEIEGWGTATELTLWTHSEDGRQNEFTGIFLNPSDAKIVSSAWMDKEKRTVIWAFAQMERAEDFK